MLSYVHDFHAGNHGDVLKHTALAVILEHLNKKDKPYTFFDSHAGSGVYNLADERAAKTGESARGIVRLKEFCTVNSNRIPDGLKPYLSEIERYDVQGLYPGSPRIAADFMRGCDKLILSELHPAACKMLRTSLREPFAAVHRRDGWEMLTALTPPVIKRGAALVDPSYELESDYKKIVRAVKSVDTTAEILSAELCVASAASHTEVPLQELSTDNAPRMYGSGMLIINFPWQLDKTLREILPFLTESLSSGDGSWSVETEF